MLGLTDYISNHRWEDILLIWYVYIDDAYQTLVRTRGRLRRRGPEPRFSGTEVITVALPTQRFFAGPEELGRWLLRQYHSDLFPHRVGASRFNRRRRQLCGVIEMVRRQVTRLLIGPQDRVRV